MRGATAIIDLGALRHNLDRVRGLAPTSRVVAVIKANGYGHGAVRLLPALARADMLGVACIEEALTLRAAGATQPVLLLEGVFEPDELPECVAHGLEIVVHEPGQLAWLEAYRGPGQLRVWLKLDSGMGRLGFLPAALRPAWDRLVTCPTVSAIRLMSHLGSADVCGSAETPGQLERLKRLFGALPAPRSIAASAGVLAWPDSHADWVRPGVMLYGVSPIVGESGADRGLRPVMHLATRVIAVKTLPAGSAIGYGASYRCQEPATVGIIAMGYGDGYPRHCHTGAPVLVNGRRTRLLGRVSMDMIAVDLDAVGGAAVGDPVTLWGPGLPVEEVAGHAGTIAYELLCGITSRVRFLVTGPDQDELQAPPTRSQE